MRTFLHKHHRLLFYSTWLILALVQSRYTELQDDEAYYWVYSHYLAWGYFDHPPMIALMIKIGYFLFHNELGVRFIAVLMNLFSLLIIEKLLSNKNQRLFYTIVLSIAVLQVGGFLAVPDTPLIFFTALFFWTYRLFCKSSSWKNTILLGVASLLLLYSKYHGILIIFFTLLSDLSLLKKYKTYVIGCIILIGFLPHLYWQYTHGWPSIQYHLVERNAAVYKPAFTLEYLIGQIFLPGPLAGFILLPAAFLYKTKDRFEKALFFSMIGIYLFFLLSSYRGFVEANWTAPVIVPLIVLGHNFLNQRKKISLLLLKMLPVTLLLTLIARVAMIVDFIPLKFIRSKYHSWSNWPMQMREKTKGLPVVFNDSYQRASKYWFYSGQMAYSPSYYRERRTNYDFWPAEDSLLGKKVYLLDINQLKDFTDSLATPIGFVGFSYDSSYASFARIQFECDSEKIIIPENTSFSLQGRAEIPKPYSSFISQGRLPDIKIVVGIFNKKGWVKDIPVPLTLAEVLHNPFTITISPHLQQGYYYFLFSIQSGNSLGTHNSKRIKLTIR